VPVDSVLYELEGFIAPQIAARRHTIHVLPCDGDVAVWADADKTIQILLNLTSNAVKYTPEGTLIEVFHDDTAGSPAHQVRICVRDGGPGIPPDKQQAIFEPFVQIGRQLNQPIEGIGLGLAISRDLARGMGGELTVESTPGHGATFILTLPRA
jgi:signal transduction histidine kinase